MMLRRTALAFALVLAPAVASAQVSDADRATARALAQQGQDALDKKDFATALDRFGRASAIVRAPTLALGQARAQVGLGRLVAAQETYQRVLRDGVPPRSPPPFVKAVADAQRELEALEPRIPSVVINVNGAPSPRVTLDGVLVPAAAIGVNRLVDPGTHVVRAEADGFAPSEAPVTVNERGVESVTLSLAPAAGAGGAGGRPAPQGGSTLKTLGFVGLGVGGAALVMGVATGVVAVGKHGTLAKLCPTGHCTNQQSTIDSYHLMTNLSTAGFVVGGVLAAAGVVLVITAPRPEAGQAWLAPVVAPGYAGVQGSF